jgi:hypothetical protein
VHPEALRKRLARHIARTPFRREEPNRYSTAEVR